MTRVRAGLLAAGALAFVGIGVWTTVDPVGALAVVGVRPVGAAGVVELRAMYGGLELGAAAFLGLCAARPAWHGPGLAASACLIGGLGVARAVWLAVLQPPDAVLYGFAALELANGVACAALIRRDGSPPNDRIRRDGSPPNDRIPEDGVRGPTIPHAQVRTGPPTGQSTGLWGE